MGVKPCGGCDWNVPETYPKCHHCGFVFVEMTQKYKDLRSLVDRIHEALGESEHSDDDSLPEVIRELRATLKAVTEDRESRGWRNREVE